MTLTASAVRPSDAIAALARAITHCKGGDALAPVVVIVPTNTCGVMARRALGRRAGVVSVDMVTLNRLAELVAGPTLAVAGRSPVSSAVLDVAIARVLSDRPGSFAAVASHPSTIVAIRQLHNELRRTGTEAVDRLAAQSRRGGETVRISRAVTTELESEWYDEGDLFQTASTLVAAGTVSSPPSVVVYLPHDLSGLPLEFVRSLAMVSDVHLVAARTGDQAGDAESIELLDSLATGAEPDVSEWPAPQHPVHVISTTDADDEVRIAVRVVIDAARDGIAFERMAVLWPTAQPYARLVEHHLTAAGINWNGRPGTEITERLAPRLALDLLDVDHRGLRRRSLFSIVADVPPRAADGSFLPTAMWERVSREAGVARDDDWDVRLGALTHSERWSESATSLLDFVTQLRSALDRPERPRAWSEWADWCVTQLDRWVGPKRLENLPEIEFRAWEALNKALDRLRHLDPVGDPVTRSGFRAALEAELDAMPARVGRVGDGVTVGSLATSVGLDVDVVVVLGAAEGSLPPRPTSDPLLSETDRAAAGLPGAERRISRLHHLLASLSDIATITFTWPRGDLRSTSNNEPSRWLPPQGDRCRFRSIDSHTAGLVATDFPASPAEHRLRMRYAHVRSGGSLIAAVDTATDSALCRALALVEARADDALTAYDGDLSAVVVPRLDGVVSPTQLETWTSCPHAYFMRYVLDVRPIEEPGDELSITALDRGSTHHRALDRFHRAVITGALPQPAAHGWGPEHRAALVEMFDDECARTQRRGRTGRRAYWSDEQERMRSDLLGWLDNDSRLCVSRQSTVLMSEHRFGVALDIDGVDGGHGGDVSLELPDGRAIRLHGSVDRIDRTVDGTIVVTDHKTGSATKYQELGPDNPTLHGSVLQLPAYAAAARALLGEPTADVLTEYGMMGKGGYERPGYTLTPEVAVTVSEQLAHVVLGIESGFFPNRPERPGWRMFVNCAYCEPDGLGTTVRWGEWVRKRHDPRLAAWFGPPDEVGRTDDFGQPDVAAEPEAST